MGAYLYCWQWSLPILLNVMKADSPSLKTPNPTCGGVFVLLAMQSSYTTKRNEGWQSEFEDTKSYLWGRISCLRWSLSSGAVNQRCMFWCLQQTVAQSNTGTETHTHTHTESAYSNHLLFNINALQLMTTDWHPLPHGNVSFILILCAMVWNLSWYSSVPLPPLKIHTHANISHISHHCNTYYGHTHTHTPYPFHTNPPHILP